MKIEYSHASEEDIDIIFQQLQALVYAYEDMNAINAEKVFAWCRRQIEQHIHEYTCIYADGNKAGYYLLTRQENSLELDNFYILPQYREKGIGTSALKHCIENAELPIRLYVFKANTRAIALYARMGFCVMEEVSATRCIMQRNSAVPEA